METSLIFAHHLAELDVVEHFLKNEPTWGSKLKYLRMDGNSNSANRNNLCDTFNNDPSIRIFMLTHKVGGMGLNLTAANRVILIGTHYNPSYDTQSIYRVYRFGQKKPCYVYRLLSIGTMEEKIYHRCVVKLAVAGTVVDKQHFDRHYISHDLQQMYEFNYEHYKDRPIPKVPYDNLLANLIHNNADIYTYAEQDKLLENKPEEELDDEAKKLAWEEFNAEQSRAKPIHLALPTLPTNVPMKTIVPEPLPPGVPKMKTNIVQGGFRTARNNNLPTGYINPYDLTRPTSFHNRIGWSQMMMAPQPVLPRAQSSLHSFQQLLESRKK